MSSSMRSDMLVASALAFISVVLWARSARQKLPLPPGPPEASWLHGHTPLIPKPGDKKTFWQTFTEWSREYGRFIISILMRWPVSYLPPR